MQSEGYLVQTPKVELGPPLHVVHPPIGREHEEQGKLVIFTVKPKFIKNFTRCCDKWMMNQTFKCPPKVYRENGFCYSPQESKVMSSLEIEFLVTWKKISRLLVKSIQGAFVMKWNVILRSTSSYFNQRWILFFRMWSLSSSLRQC